MLQICGKHKRGRRQCGRETRGCDSFLFPEYLNSFLRIKTDTERLKQLKVCALLKDTVLLHGEKCSLFSMYKLFLFF